MRRLRAGRVAITLLVGCLVSARDVAEAAGERFAVIVSGATGGEPFATSYDQWRSAIVLALRDRYGFPERRLHVLAERPDAIAVTATRENVRRVFEGLQDEMGADDSLIVVLIGHGTFDGIDAKFNLVGPDLDAIGWAQLLEALPGRIVVINTSSASFPFLQQTSRRGRVVVSATDSAGQRFETMFPEALAEAMGSASSDLDKNGRLSVWEAFSFASARVREWYAQRGRLATERAVLDDNGDGIGKEAGEPGPDGALAGRVYFDRIDDLSDADDPELVRLGRQRSDLEAEIDAVRAQRESMDPAEYAGRLEALLIELARVSRLIRSKS